MIQKCFLVCFVVCFFLSPGLYGCAARIGDHQAGSAPVQPASQVRLSWQPPSTKSDSTPLSGPVGYKIYYGQRSRQYGFIKTIGNQTTADISGLVPGQTYYFTVTAFDSAGAESSFSDEVSLVAPSLVSQTVTLMQDALRRGRESQWRVIGANPGEVASFLFSATGEGEGPCSPQLGGLCIELIDPSVFGEAIADASGNAILTKTIPPDARLGQAISIQAVIQRGANGATSVKTNPITAIVTD